MPLRARSQRLLVVLTACLTPPLYLRLSLPSTLPPRFHALSHAPTPTLDTLARTLHSPPQTPLHAAYSKSATCARAPDLRALRAVIAATHAPTRRFVACLTRPPPPAHLSVLRKLAARLGPPFVTDPDPLLRSTLTAFNITHTVPESPDHALAAMAHAAALLLSPSPACALGARLAKGVVYYTADYHAYVAAHGYEWLPDNPARLDAFDRSHSAVLAGLGPVEESCCAFRDGVCNPANGCSAVVMGELRNPPCAAVKVCRECPPWATLANGNVPDVLLMDIAGAEFRVLRDVAAADNGPTQLVMRLRVWAERDGGEGWARGRGGWVVSRSFVADTVARLRRRGYRLVHRVDDPECEWCAFVTFLKDDWKGA